MKKLNKSLLVLLLCLPALPAWAQQDVEMADVMRSEGKIYVVIAIILVILAGLFIYLFSMDKKISKLEKRIDSK